MAMAENVTNAQLRDALIALGLIPQDQWNQIDLTGAQNGYFKNGLMTSRNITQDQFDAAKALARWNGDAADQGDIMDALGKIGIQLNTSDDAQTMFQRMGQIQSGQPLSIYIPNAQAGQPGGPPAQGQPGGPSAPPVNPQYTPQAVSSGIPTVDLSKNQYDYSDKIQTAGNLPTASMQPGQAALTNPKGGAAAPAPGSLGQPPPQNIPVPGPNNPTDLKTYIQQNAGADAWFINVPEAWDIIQQISAKPGDLASKLGIFEQQITTSDWWKNTSATVRQNTAEKFSDPPTWAASLATTAQSITAYATDQGVNIDPARAQSIAESAQLYGWSPQQIDQAVAAEYHYDPSNKLQGQTATLVKNLASQYMVPLSDQAVQSWTQGMMSGQYTQDYLSRYLGSQAKTLFPWMSTDIDQGMTPSTYLEPFKQKIASTLEIDPNTVDWTQSKWSNLLNQKDAKTGQLVAPSLTDVTRQIQTDPQYGWNKTQGALQAATQMGNTILKSFGIGG